jgi:hypothetical protein
MTTEDSVLRILLRFGLDADSLTAAKVGVNEGAAGVTAGLKATEDQAKRTKEQLQQLKTAGRELSQIGRDIGLVGAAISGPLLLAAKSFVDANQKTSYIAQAWLRDTNSMEASYTRVGGVVVGQLLPAMDQSARLVDKLATFAEQNPGLVKMALGASGTLVGAGAALIAAGSLAQTAANVGLLFTMLGRAGLLTSGVVSTAVGVGGAGLALAGGAAAGYGLTAALGIDAAHNGNQVAQAFQSATESLRLLINKIYGTNWQVQNTAMYGPPKPPGYDIYANRYGSADLSARQTEGNATSFYGGYSSGTAAARALAQPAYSAFQATSQTNLDAYQAGDSATRLAYLKSTEAAQGTFDNNRRLQIRDFNEQETQIEKSYNSSRLLQLRDFNEQQASTQKSFDESNTKAATAHSTDMSRLAQDQAAGLAQLSGDHEDRLRELAANRDALGFVKEQRSYERQKAELEANNKKEVDRRNQDYTTQQADAKTAFDEARARQQAAFQQSQDDAAKAYQDQKDQRADQFAQQKQDAQDAFTAQQLQAKTNFNTALATDLANFTTQQTALAKAFTDGLDPLLTGMTAQVEKKGQDTSDQFGKFLDGLESQVGGGPGYCGPGYHWDATQKACVVNTPHGTMGGSAAGGYVGRGLRMLGEQGIEFVLNNQTVTAAERLGSGPLSQEKILAALGRGNTSYNVNIGGITASWGDKASALEGVIGLVDAKITDAFNQFHDDVGSN